MQRLYTPLLTPEGHLDDILYNKDGVDIPILGHNGKTRELQKLQLLTQYEKKYQNILPIFIGFGAGLAIEEYSKRNTPFIVIDLENISGIVQQYLTINTEQATIITENDYSKTVEMLDTIIQKLQYPLCIPIIHHFIKTHHLKQYQPYIQRCRELARYNPLGKTRYKHFTKENPFILCLWRESFITTELITAMEQQGIQYVAIPVAHSIPSVTIISTLIEYIQKYKPDFIFTINHTGFDTTNILSEIIHQFQIPVASWFVDNPELDIEKYTPLISSNTVIFTYDKKNIPYLNSIGIEHAYYLPLATNITSFSPNSIPSQYHSWKAILGFLGDSRNNNIRKYIQNPYTPLLHCYSVAIAECFRTSSLYTVPEVIREYYPFLYTEFEQLLLPERRDYIQLILDFATQKKRTLSLLNACIVPSTILGDDYWKVLLPPREHVYIGSSIPYSNAQYLYTQVDILLNSTCTQMKDSVNQRVFDAPIAGTLVLTEYTQQLEDLFDIGTEVVCYTSDEEVQDKINYYYKNPQERLSIINKARIRVESEHTWGHRIQSILSTMKRIYG